MQDQTVPTDTAQSGTSVTETTFRSGLLGEIFYGEDLTDLDAALAAMSGSSDAVFVSNGIDYELTRGTLGNLLGDDASSLSSAEVGLISDQFALRLSGQVYLEEGTHRFFNRTDDGFRLSIDGKTIAEYNSPRAIGTTIGEITVSRAGWYDIRVDYFEQAGHAALLIDHSHNGSVAAPLDASKLRHGDIAPVDPETPTDNATYAAGLKGAVHLLAGGVQTVDEAIQRSTGAPAAEFVSSQVYYQPSYGDLATILGADSASLTNVAIGGRSDNFGLTLEGQIYLESGSHSFGASTDDGFRLTINGEVVAEHLGPRPISQTLGTIQIDRTGWYDIRINYFENLKVAGLELWHGLNGAPLELIRPDALRHAIEDGSGQEPEPAVNTAPVARDDGGFAGTVGQMVMISAAQLLGNDSDADGDALSIIGITNVQNGTATLSNGVIHFTGKAAGPASFDYVLSDGQGGQDRANVSLTIEAPDNGGGGGEEPAVNTAPVARDDGGFAGTAGQMVMISAAQLLGNDSDADGDALSIVSITNVQNGTATLSNGMIHFTGNAAGPASFDYVLSDGQGGQDRANVSLTIEAPDNGGGGGEEPAVNTAPVARDDGGFAGTAGQMVMISAAQLLGNDSDADGDALSIVSITNVQNGTATLSNGMIHFTGDAAGPASFDYVLSDGQGGQDRANVSLNIQAPDSGGGDGGTDPGTGHGGHENHGGFEMIDVPQTAAEIAAFLEMVRSMPEGHSHAGGSSMAEEHMAAMELAPRGEATHIAIRHGDWNDASIWHNGQVPSDDARVLIPEGVMVTYSSVNQASIFTVRVDGMLDFSTTQDSRLLVDTMVVSPSGHLVIGTEDDPVRANVNVDIVFADNGDIDVGWDSMLLSRGLVAHGSTSIHGAEKASHLKVEIDAMAGDRTLVLEERPDGWEVGDKLVLTGTYQQGWYWSNETRRMEFTESQDEEVYITRIDGNVITLNRPLTYDHDTPRDDLKAYVANMTRNVTFSSEGGDDLPAHQRGHVMFMHSDDVDVRYAGFVDLGRTDKSVSALPLDAAGGAGNLESDTNLQSRYPFHFHKTGVSDLENPAMAVGNVVDGSPGWGFVHHDSNANFTNNVAFDVFGAAFVAEDGNETGIWYQNIAIKAEGIGFSDSAVKTREGDYRDDGRTGDGFFFGGRLVEAAENVAANTTNGYVWFHRYERASVDAATLHQPDLAYGSDQLGADKPSIQGFRDNEAFGTHSGIIVIKASPDQGHDGRSVFDGFLNWETREGINLSYTAHYTFLDVDLVGQRPGGGAGDQTFQGITLGGNVYDMVFNRVSIDGFVYGVNLQNNETTTGVARDLLDNTIIDATFLNIGRQNVNESQPGLLSVLTSDDLAPGRIAFDYQGVTTLRPNMDLLLLGSKTDSIGTVDRSFFVHPQGMFRWDVPSFLEENGYYRLADGTAVAIVPDYISDRATGELTKISHVIRLDFSASDLSNRYQYNGILDPNAAPPVARNDRAETLQDTDVIIDLAANDSSPRGSEVFVDGMTDPNNGDVYLQEDGTVLYRPNIGFSGTDQFHYWASDGQGNYTRATATVTVAPDLQTAMMSDMFEF